MEKQDLAVFPIPCALFKSGKPIDHREGRMKDVDAIKKSCQEAQKQFQIRIETVAPASEVECASLTNVVAICLGSQAQVASAKSWLLARHQRQVRGCSSDLVTSGHQAQIKHSVMERMTEIMRATHTDIQLHFINGGSVAPILMSVDGLGDVSIDIRGRLDDIERAKKFCLVYFDELAGSAVGKVEVSAPIQLVMNGRKRSKLRNLLSETQSNIYLPHPFVHFGHRANDKSPESSKVFITAKDQINIEKAIGEIKKMSETTKIISKTITLAKRKFDYLHRHQARALADIMWENATLIVCDPETIASPTGRVSLILSSDREANINKAILSLATLCGEWVVSELVLLGNLIDRISRASGFTAGSNTMVPALFLQLGKISQNHGVEINAMGGGMEIMGNAQAMLPAGHMVMELHELHQNIHEAHFQLEMSSEYRDFITGKKNGKLNKITKACGVTINLHEPETFDLVVEISCQVYSKGLEAYLHLRDELPAELEFFIPDIHHKRIIGVGGKNIQGIMKQFGVYVKFMSNDDFKSVGGILDEDKNVIARTPAKNSSNLISLYHAIVDLVDPREKDFITMIVESSRRYHRNIALTRKSLEDRTRTTITLPLPDIGEDNFVIRGLEKEIQRAVIEMKLTLPESYMFRAPVSEKIDAFVKSDKFKQLSESLQTQYKIRLAPKQPSDPKNKDDYCFLLSGNQNTVKDIRSCINQLVSTMKDNEIPLYPQSGEEEIARPPTATGMKIQPTALPASYSSNNLPPMRKPSILEDTRNTLPAGSAPNLRALKMNVDTNVPSWAKMASPSSASAKLNPIGSGVVKPKDVTIDTSSLSRGLESPMLKTAVDQILTPTGFSKLSLADPSTSMLGGLLSPRIDVFMGKDFGAMAPASANPSREQSGLRRAGRLSIQTNVMESGERDDGNGDMEGSGFLRSVVSSILSNDNHPVTSNSRETAGNNKMSILLDSLELGKYKQTFIDHDVDFEMFLTLTADDFRELGLSLGARKKLTAAIEEIRSHRQVPHSSIRTAIPTSLLSPSVGGPAQQSLSVHPARSTPTSPTPWVASPLTFDMPQYADWSTHHRHQPHPLHQSSTTETSTIGLPGHSHVTMLHRPQFGSSTASTAEYAGNGSPSGSPVRRPLNLYSPAPTYQNSSATSAAPPGFSLLAAEFSPGEAAHNVQQQQAPSQWSDHTKQQSGAPGN